MPTERRRPFDVTLDEDTPVYVISVAAQLTGLHPQTLRTYDRLGLVSPGRTGGGGRRYSLRDIEILRHVTQLTAAGIGLEGVRRILELEHLVEALQDRVSDLEEQLESTQVAMERAYEQAAFLPELLPQQTQAVVLWQGKRRRRR
ncbi:heat shock protein transcriptional repressor HspR [Tenggerimyces flavus]|uniref:Heat shock protein transcriptional repressor HspR n=1 Tax=Tenggerimyces flavus TaxID=1708749 RepID=A0ABV7YI68_9ACTN|nr:MerR family transcriptional regulator [Tenggerimyces flavus]MBM7784087.1 MerR family transcriptional regulator/heat shock protein HspR [Tenggerimyces flavus]